MAGPGLAGRPWGERPADRYCCAGCLDLGERARGGGVGPLGGGGWRLAAGAFLAAQSMMLGLAVSLTEPEGMARTILHGVVLAATLAVAALLGDPLAAAAWQSLRRGRLGVEALFLAGIAGAFGASLDSMARGRGPIYFEVVSILLVVYAVGKAVGARSRASALESSRAWAGAIGVARRVGADGGTALVEVAEVRPGDRVEVRAGELIAVDGQVIAGVASVREGALSGESAAVVRREGDRVWAGTAVEDARLVIVATAAAGERRVDRLIAAVERSRERPGTIQHQADRLASRFVPVVVAVALATFVGWAIADGWEPALYHAMAVLLVACPCALGLATPVAIWTALGRLASRGVVARDGEALERLAAVDHVLMDKTGTLTEDRAAVVDLAVAEGVDRVRLAGWLASVEAGGAHPIARGFADLAAPLGFVVDHRAVPGAGVEAELVDPREPGTMTIRLGRPGWLDPVGEGPDWKALVDNLKAGAGASLVYATIDGRPVAVAAVAERARESAAEAVAAFERLGLPVEVMTGDTPGRAEALMVDLGLGRLPVAAGISPEAKRRRVDALAAVGRRPLFVGDGLNDGPALAAAFVGVATASGTDLAVEAAGLTLYGGDLGAIPWAVALARRTVAGLRRVLMWAAVYNLAGMALAATGWLHPVAASLLMVGSSLWVGWRASRLADADGADADCACGPGREAVAVDRAPAAGAAWAHGLATAAQGPLLAVLAGCDAIGSAALAVGFGAAGVLGARAWRRGPIGADADMAFGMFTVGGLGMLIGAFADEWIVSDPSWAAHCLNGGGGGAAAGMWVGMLAAGNLAMFGLARRPLREAEGSAGLGPLVVGANLGMAAGMAGGAWLAGRLGAGPGPEGAMVGYGLMMGGMTAGMIVGHRACCAAARVAVARRLRKRAGAGIMVEA